MGCIDRAVKLRLTRERRVFAGEWSTPTKGAGDCRPADDGQRQEVSAVDGDVLRSANGGSRSGEKEALTHTENQDVLAWCRTRLGISVTAQRHAAYASPTGTKTG
jgi:hypothetical protein